MLFDNLLAPSSARAKLVYRRYTGQIEDSYYPLDATV